MSRPGLVSQRQCKVTARRTRASRYRHVCNGSFSPIIPCVTLCHPYHSRPVSCCLSTSFIILSWCGTHRCCASAPPCNNFFVQCRRLLLRRLPFDITAYSPPLRFSNKICSTHAEISNGGHWTSYVHYSTNRNTLFCHTVILPSQIITEYGKNTILYLQVVLYQLLVH